MKQALAVLCAFALLASPALAQFSTDLPGVPRGRAAFLSGGQGRFELDFAGYKLPATEGDSLAGSLRIGFGNSWRIGSNFELGYDLSLGELRVLKPANLVPDADAPPIGVNGTVLYGVRVGLKYQFFNVVDPDGYGISASVGGAFHPELEPVFLYSKEDTTTLTGGYAGDAPEEGGIDAVLSASTIFMGAVSYRMERFDADAALVMENLSEAEGVSPVRQYDGVSLALGARYRLTGGFAVGISYWGSGAPPWRDRIKLDLREEDEAKFGFLLSFGSQLEEGTDIMISSPTGSFSESISIYLRVH